MDTRRLEYFVQIVDAGSINRAAQTLGIAQPALSQHLRALEADMKTTLLDRLPSGVTPTLSGQRLYLRAQAILRQIGSLKLELSEAAQEVAGIAAVGMPPSIAAAIGLNFLARMLEQYPSVRLQLIEDGASGLLQRLQNGLLDMSVAAVQWNDPALRDEILFKEELGLVCAPIHVPDQITLDTLARLPWIVTSTSNAIRGHLDAIFSQAGLVPNIVAEVNSLSVVIKVVRAGLGVTLLPARTLKGFQDVGELHTLSFPNPIPQRTIHLYQRSQPPPSRLSSAVREVLLQVIAGYDTSVK